MRPQRLVLAAASIMPINPHENSREEHHESYQ